MSLSVKTQGGGGGVGMYASIFATGVSETDTVTLTTPKGIVKSGKWTSRAMLPEEYQEVEYLGGNTNSGQADGAYIKLGVPTKNGYSVKCKVSISDPEASDNARAILGSNIAPYESFIDICQSKFGGYLGGGSRYTLPFDVIADKVYELEFISRIGEQKVNIDGVNYLDKATTDMGDGEVLLFAVDDAGYEVYRVSNFKFHGETQVYDNDWALIHNFIPCYIKATGEAGLYDLVSKTFFGNDGTGEFIVGPDVVHGGFLFEKLKDIGMYTLNADNGKKTAEAEVFVDMATEYQIEVLYATYLYREGDECEDITGGWSDGWQYGGGGSVTKNSDHFVVYAAYGQNAKGCETNQKVSIDGCVYLKAEVVPVDCSSEQYFPNYLYLYAIDTRGNWDEIEHCAAANTTGFNNDTVQNLFKNLTKGESAIIYYDISALTGNKYVGLASYGGNHWEVHRVWLE